MQFVLSSDILTVYIDLMQVKIRIELFIIKPLNRNTNKMPELLFEIGTEELPPGLINSLTDQIKKNVINGLNEYNISYKNESIQTFSTPRRIGLIIEGLPLKQEFKEVEIKGPDKEKAFDKEGRPTQAAIGFAKKYNLEPKDLIIKRINNAEYIHIKAKIGGQNTLDVLSKILPDSIKKTTGDKFMKWGNYDEKFARPIRWILAILDNQIIKFSYANLESSNQTHGHRFLSDKPITINSPKEYEKKLTENNVLVSRDKRLDNIKKQIESEAKKASGIVDIDKDLLDEVTNITEYPKSLICNFESTFLELPECIIETVLRKHQKYFVVKDPKTKKLTNNFIVITNGIEVENEKYKSHIKKGNEKVVRARLNDAKFFYEEDLKRPFTYEERIKDLSKITFQKGLGSMEEKVERIINFSDLIYNSLTNQGCKLRYPKQDLINAAKLCKLDLSTQMVFEMPELQGKIGTIYAQQKNNQQEIVYRSIEEHYTNTGNDNTIAQLIGIADKLDNILSLFAIGKIPTSSSDPFGLRAQTQWILIVIEIIQDQYKAVFNLSKIIDSYKSQIASNELKAKLTNESLKRAKDFLVERLKLRCLATHCGLNDLVEATFSVTDPLSNIYLVQDNLTLLNSHFFEPNEEDKAFLLAAKRLVRILEPNTNGNIELSMLKLEEEKMLFKMFEEISNVEHEDLDEYYMALKRLVKPINNFFDKVLVNDPDIKIKQARHALLKKGKDLFEKICDFNLIQERN